MLEIEPANTSTILHQKESAVMQATRNAVPQALKTELSTSHAAQPSFHRFNDLPTELRYLIWVLALPGPRVIKLEQRRLESHFYSSVRSDIPIEFPMKPEDPTLALEHLTQWFGSVLPIGMRYYYGMRPKCPPPAILYANREGYNIASKFYTRAFGTEHVFPETWIDFERDIVFLDLNNAKSDMLTSSWLGHLRPEELGRVKTLLTNRHKRHSGVLATTRILASFGNVEVLRIMESHSEYSDWKVGILDMNTMERLRIRNDKNGGTSWKMPKVEYLSTSEFTRAWNWKLQDWDDDLLAIKSMAGYMD
jgi:hypothetical protein